MRFKIKEKFKKIMMRYCSECGGKLSYKLIEGKKRAVCLSCGKIHYQNSLPTVVGVVTKEGKKVIGLIKRAIDPEKGKWALPGGFIEKDEGPQEALIREIKEEIGMRGKIQGLIGVYTDESKTYGKVIVIAYQFFTLTDKYPLGKEVKEFKFFIPTQIPPIIFPSHQRIVQDFNKTYRNPIPTVDAVIEKEGRVILVERKNPPYGWALPGGFVDYGETLEEAIKREVKEETNLKIKDLKQFHSYSNPDRDPRMHTITTVFLGKAEGNLVPGDDAKELAIFPKDKLPSNLAFDHKKILQDYFKSIGN